MAKRYLIATIGKYHRPYFEVKWFKNKKNAIQFGNKIAKKEKRGDYGLFEYEISKTDEIYKGMLKRF